MIEMPLDCLTCLGGQMYVICHWPICVQAKVLLLQPLAFEISYLLEWLLVEQSFFLNVWQKSSNTE